MEKTINMTNIKKLTAGNWIQTDASTGQKARFIEDFVYELSEGNHQQTINLSEYDNEEIEYYIMPYGYTIETLLQDNEPIMAYLIIAECIFESYHM